MKANERLEMAIAELGITPYKLSKLMGYKSPDSVYNAIKNANAISDSFLSRLADKFIPINIRWIREGLGSPVANRIKRGGYGNELNIGERIMYPALLDHRQLGFVAVELMEIKGLMVNTSCRVEVQRSLDYGVGFFFTTYWDEDDSRYLNRRYYFLMNADWDISEYYDSWPIDRGSQWRSENIFKSFPKSKFKYAHVGIETQRNLLEKEERGEVCITPYLTDDCKRELEREDLLVAFAVLRDRFAEDGRTMGNEIAWDYYKSLNT